MVNSWLQEHFSLPVDGSQLANMHIMDRNFKEYHLYAKFLIAITHRNSLQTKKKDNNVSVFYHE